jgi:hypothetical protein
MKTALTVIQDSGERWAEIVLAGKLKADKPSAEVFAGH